jgi:hypothetical protein
MSDRRDDNEPPPFLQTWPRVYAMVVIYLVVLIIGFYLFCRWVTPAVSA